MNPTLRKVLVYSAKNAVNAVLTNAGLTAMFPQFMHWGHPLQWWVDVGKVALSSVVARELLVWGPKLLKWSQTTD